MQNTISRRHRRALAPVAVVALVVAGSVGGCASPASSPDAAVARLAEELGAGDVTQSAGAAAQRDLTTVLAGMDGLRPRVSVTSVRRSGDTADATFTVTWPLLRGPWTYTTTGRFTRSDNTWSPQWAPTMLNPKLGRSTRLVHHRSLPRRADILDADGTALMTYRPVLRLGINKPDTSAAHWSSSATALAARLGINAAAYRTRVMAAGPKAFVQAIVLRSTDGDGGPDLSSVPGAREFTDVAVLGPTKGFAAGVLGQVGEATPDQAARSKGLVLAGDPIGLTGLQARYDRQLRGQPGEQVVLRSRSTWAQAAADVVLFDIASTPGTPLRTTLVLDQQLHAEAVLAKARPASAIVAINPTTGHVLAAATGTTNTGTGDATVGRYPPGSTFKAVTALALLRAGMTPDSMVNCSSTVTVDGRRFKNYNDFPASRVGRMTLRDAIALSCNTALIAEHGRIDGPALRSAANSLGLGQDWDTGFASFLGSVPDPKDVVGLAASMIGQGLVEASPLAMATVAASIQAGHTVRPILVVGHGASAPAAPALTAAEAAQLQDMLHAVVTVGSGRILAGLADGAKTGTAEYGADTPPRTHAWMIAYRSGLAVSTLVADGDSGSGTAGPLLAAFMR